MDQSFATIRYEQILKYRVRAPQAASISTPPPPSLSSSPLDLHPLLYQLFHVGCRMLDRSLDVVFRKSMRNMLVTLNEIFTSYYFFANYIFQEFLQAQMSKFEGAEFLRHCRRDLIDHVMDIGKFVKSYDEPKFDVTATQVLMDINQELRE
ncbi:hypothetical protein HELRODRAFT_160949 [Helobdella robusta]|uniref:Uncharacterized protein n=1 Tax=Helobdella robusta TaxID=6412 RepID=T1EQW7_HELRO|nr:hypothetical protein HELRODRAFT_160949 [Helobdella robusta]ESO01787.1 hypothetical protein HELRODRAFT_160949 [Helobdella robusta]